MPWIATTLLKLTLPNGDTVDTGPSNIILRDIHPVVWAARPQPKGYKTKQTTYLLFFAEIPSEIADHPDVKKWCEEEY